MKEGILFGLWTAVALIVIITLLFVAPSFFFGYFIYVISAFFIIIILDIVISRIYTGGKAHGRNNIENKL